MKYGNKLNPEHSLRTAKGIKGTRQKSYCCSQSQ